MDESFLSPVFNTFLDTDRRAKSQTLDLRIPSRCSCATPESFRSSLSASNRFVGCERVRSRLDDSIDVNPLARHCCEVLGKSVCHYCGKIAFRADDVVRCESCLPAIGYNSDLASTSLVLKRYFPKATPKELHDMVARGKVAPLSESSPSAVNAKLKEENYGIINLDKSLSRPKTFASDGTTLTYFHNIRDLSWKMGMGRFENIDQDKQAFLLKFRASFSRSDSSKGHLPTFNSSRRLNTHSTSYKSYYFPPLCTKEMQERKNDFFAGDSEPEVTFIKKLPEHVIPLHVTKELDRQLDEARKACEEVDVEFEKGLEEDFIKIYGSKR